ncbi:MAG: LCP family protein [Eubacterium sp.]|nr:LCP family protein [Eubacterium sp.]MBR4241514.1 LCP family protein [Eubacterium sp.]MBR7060659.1 LCP family protein [Eubacterium sp.]
MAVNKDNYDIDDILSEVKKRREENIYSDAPSKEVAKEVSEVIPEEAPKATEATEEPEIKTEAKQTTEEGLFNIISVAEEENEAQIVENTIETAQNEESENGEQRKNKKKKTKIILSIIAAIVVVAIAAAAIFANDMIDRLIKNGESTVATTEAPWQGMDKLIEDFSPIDETEATQLSSLQDMIKSWYYNGKPCSSTHVLNVLFIGEDTRGDEILEEGTRADSAIIVSVNIDTGVITLTSILRDAYTYWETKEGDESTGQFGKINGAMSTGDINAYINCVEKMYKIKIDNYAIVNFDSFETIVDTLGGVTLELTEAEINEINNHPKRYGNVTIEKTFEGNKGKMKLTGKQALAYCRIRKLDSDNMRADRQKTCMMQIFKQTKDASAVRLLKIVNKLIPYVKTNFGRKEIRQISKYALSQGWLDFDIYMQNLPEHNLKGGMGYGAWIWKCDFPADAYNLQYIIYGKSSITLAHTRVNTATCPERGFYSEGSAAMGSYYTVNNDKYGEVTVVETTTKKNSESKTTSN